MDIEDLKCCGNCEHIESDYEDFVCGNFDNGHSGKFVNPYDYCDFWVYDGLYKGKRVNRVS